YLIAYYPSARLADSDYRSIEIKIDPNTKDYPNPGDLQVRHRTAITPCRRSSSSALFGSPPGFSKGRLHCPAIVFYRKWKVGCRRSFKSSRSPLQPGAVFWLWRLLSI